MEEKEMTFDEFEELVDEDDIIFGKYKHLNESARFAAYLFYLGKEEERMVFVGRELERLKKEPVDDNIYFLVIQAELLNTNDVALYKNITNHVLIRAKEMVEKKFSSAWMAVRAYGWIKNSDLSVLPEFLSMTDDVTVWQVVMQCMTRRGLSQNELTYCRNKCYTYTARLVDRLDPAQHNAAVYAAAINGVQALMRLLDERALELIRKMPKRHLHKEIAAQADRLMEKLKEQRMSQYIPVLMEIKQLTQ